jgi:hypothetical protein
VSPCVEVDVVDEELFRVLLESGVAIEVNVADP